MNIANVAEITKPSNWISINTILFDSYEQLEALLSTEGKILHRPHKDKSGKEKKNPKNMRKKELWCSTYTLWHVDGSKPGGKFPLGIGSICKS